MVIVSCIIMAIWFGTTAYNRGRSVVGYAILGFVLPLIVNIVMLKIYWGDMHGLPMSSEMHMLFYKLFGVATLILGCIITSLIIRPRELTPEILTRMATH